MNETVININNLTCKELHSLYEIIQEYLEYLNRENEKIDIEE